MSTKARSRGRVASKRKPMPWWWILAKLVFTLVAAALTVVAALGYGLAYGIVAILCASIVGIATAVEHRAGSGGFSRAPHEEHSDCTSGCRTSRAPRSICRCPCGGRTHGQDRKPARWRQALSGHPRDGAPRGATPRPTRPKPMDEWLNEPIRPHQRRASSPWSSQSQVQKPRTRSKADPPPSKSRATAKESRRTITFRTLTGGVAIALATPGQVDRLRRDGRFIGFGDLRDRELS